MIEGGNFIDESIHMQPQPILDKQIYAKIGKTVIFEARPPVVHYGGYELNKVHRMRVRILNTSKSMQHIDIFPPTTPFFKLEYEKKGILAPGMAEVIDIKFVPTTWKYYYDCIRIHCDLENLLIPIHAYPVVNDVIFPTLIEFGECKLGQTYTKKIPIRCNVPIEFEYELTMVNPHHDINVYPMSGIIPANDATEVLIQYTPSSETTANSDISINVSQFNFEPFNCHISGFCSPNSTAVPELHTTITNYKTEKFKTTTLTNREETAKMYREKVRKETILRKKQEEEERIRLANIVEVVDIGVRDNRDIEDMTYIDNEHENYKEMEKKFLKLLSSVDTREKNIQLQPDRNMIGENIYTTEETNNILYNRNELKTNNEKKTRENDRNCHELIKIKSKNERMDLYANQVYDTMPSFNKYDDERIWKYKLFLVDNYVKAVSILQVRNRVRNRIDAIRERIRKNNGNVQYMINDDNNNISSSTDIISNLNIPEVPKDLFPPPIPVYNSNVNDLPKVNEYSDDITKNLNINDSIYINYKRLVIPEEYKLNGYKTYNDSYYTNVYLDCNTKRDKQTGAIEEYKRKSESKIKIYNPLKTGEENEENNVIQLNSNIIDTSVRYFDELCSELETSISYPLRTYDRNREIQENVQFRSNNTVGCLSLNTNYKIVQSNNFVISTDGCLNNGLNEGCVHSLLLSNTNLNYPKDYKYQYNITVKTKNYKYMNRIIEKDLKHNERDIDDEDWNGLKIYSMDEINDLFTDNDPEGYTDYEIWNTRMEYKDKSSDNNNSANNDNGKGGKGGKDKNKKDAKDKKKSVKGDTMKKAGSATKGGKGKGNVENEEKQEEEKMVLSIYDEKLYENEKKRFEERETNHQLLSKILDEVDKEIVYPDNGFTELYYK